MGDERRGTWNPTRAALANRGRKTIGIADRRHRDDEVRRSRQARQ